MLTPIEAAKAARDQGNIAHIVYPTQMLLRFRQALQQVNICEAEASYEPPERNPVTVESFGIETLDKVDLMMQESLLEIKEGRSSYFDLSRTLDDLFMQHSKQWREATRHLDGAGVRVAERACAEYPSIAEYFSSDLDVPRTDTYVGHAVGRLCSKYAGRDFTLGIEQWHRTRQQNQNPDARNYIALVLDRSTGEQLVDIELL